MRRPPLLLVVCVAAWASPPSGQPTASPSIAEFYAPSMRQDSNDDDARQSSRASSAVAQHDSTSGLPTASPSIAEFYAPSMRQDSKDDDNSGSLTNSTSSASTTADNDQDDDYAASQDDDFSGEPLRPGPVQDDSPPTRRTRVDDDDDDAAQREGPLGSLTSADSQEQSETGLAAHIYVLLLLVIAAVTSLGLVLIRCYSPRRRPSRPVLYNRPSSEPRYSRLKTEDSA